MKMKKVGGGGGGGIRVGVNEWRGEAFVKIQKKKYKYIFFGGGLGGIGLRGGEGGGGVRVDVN